MAKKKTTEKKGLRKEARVIRRLPVQFDLIPTYAPYPLDNQLEANRIKMRKWCRYLYLNHWLVRTVVNLYAEFPITGLGCSSEDQEEEDYFTEFLEDIKMQKLLANIGIEYWRLGETFVGGEWDEEAQEWTSLFLIPPEMIKLEREDILTPPTYYLKISDKLRTVIYQKQPRDKYDLLEKYYPELIKSIQSGKNEMPITDESNFKIWHLKNEANSYDDYGHPFLSNSFRMIVMEEKTLRSLEAVNDWYESPIMHAKLKTDLDGNPPTADDMIDMENKLVEMLEAQSRVLVTDDLVDLAFVNMERPQLTLLNQLDKYTERLLISMGINRAIIQGEAVTYAGASIATDFLIQRFEAYRQDMIDFLNDVANKVCEARGWETPPSWIFTHMDFRDRNAQKEFLIKLRSMGLPVSAKTIFESGDIDYDDELGRYEEEQKPQETKPINVELPEESKEVSPRSHEIPPEGG